MPDVILPVLDEAGAIPTVLARMPPGYDPIVVDNGSTDESASVARGLGARVVFEPRRGFGAACFCGLLAAEAHVVCFMDCDGSLDAAQLPLVAEPVQRGEADLVLGSRARGARGEHRVPLHARLANAALTTEINRRTGVQMSDLGPMRAARRDALLALGLRDRRFGWSLEMAVRAARSGWRIREVPVLYSPRVGRSKVTGTVRGSLRTARDMAWVLKTEGAS